MAAFQGPGRVLDAGGIAAPCDPPTGHAAGVRGLLADPPPLILFERHYFSRLTKRKFDAQAPDISQKQWGGYRGGSREYDRLARALKLHRVAAPRSASWGGGQGVGA